MSSLDDQFTDIVTKKFYEYEEKSFTISVSRSNKFRDNYSIILRKNFTFKNKSTGQEECGVQTFFLNKSAARNLGIELPRALSVIDEISAENTLKKLQIKKQADAVDGLSDWIRAGSSAVAAGISSIAGALGGGVGDGTKIGSDAGGDRHDTSVRARTTDAGSRSSQRGRPRKFAGGDSSAAAAAAANSCKEKGKADLDANVSAGYGSKTRTKATSRLALTSRLKRRLPSSDSCDGSNNEATSEPDADAKPDDGGGCEPIAKSERTDSESGAIKSRHAIVLESDDDDDVQDATKCK